MFCAACDVEGSMWQFFCLCFFCLFFHASCLIICFCLYLVFYVWNPEPHKFPLGDNKVVSHFWLCNIDGMVMVTWCDEIVSLGRQGVEVFNCHPVVLCGIFGGISFALNLLPCLTSMSWCGLETLSKNTCNTDNILLSDITARESSYTATASLAGLLKTHSVVLQ